MINPATEQPFTEVATADLPDVSTAVKSAQIAWESGWRDLTPGKRTEVLFSVARKRREQSEETAQLETLQIGKPIGDARDEAALGARVFEYSNTSPRCSTPRRSWSTACGAPLAR